MKNWSDSDDLRYLSNWDIEDYVFLTINPYDLKGFLDAWYHYSICLAVGAAATHKVERYSDWLSAAFGSNHDIEMLEGDYAEE